MYTTNVPAELRLDRVRDSGTDQVPMELMERIADMHAVEVWGLEVGRGSPLPIFNESNEVILYAFPYVIGSRQFPAPEVLLMQFRNHRHSYNAQFSKQTTRDAMGIHNSYLSAIRNEVERFGTIYVSATRSLHPVLQISHQLHPYFYSAEVALMMAEKEGRFAKPKLSRIKIEPPCYEYFEIEDSGEILLLHVGTLLSRQAIHDAVAKFGETTPSLDAEAPASEPSSPDVEAAWRYFEEGWPEIPTFVFDRLGKVPDTFPPPPPPPLPQGGPEETPRVPTTIPDELAPPSFPVLKLISHPDLVPPILWTHWCAPTAISMVLAYWDRFVPGRGSTAGYERLVDYWLIHPDSGNNVPNLIDELVELGCDHPRKLTNDRNGYNWDYSVIEGHYWDEWAWPELKAEIDASRPVMWQTWAPGHANCAFGYRITTYGARFVILYNTWDKHRHEQLYNAWAGQGLHLTKLMRYAPGGAEPSSLLIITSPYGQEVFLAADGIRIKFIAQSRIKMVRIEYSTNGGQSWNYLVEMEPTNLAPVETVYNWEAPPPTNEGRIRLKGYSSNGEYLAGDGSYENFCIVQVPTSIIG